MSAEDAEGIGEPSALEVISPGCKQPFPLFLAVLQKVKACVGKADYSRGIRWVFGGYSKGIRGYSDRFQGIRASCHLRRYGSYHTGSLERSAQVTLL